MSKLDDLIAELCPDGVEFVRVGDVTEILRGKRLTKSQLSNGEKYPVFHGGLEPLGYYGESNRKANTVMVINVGASAGTVGYSTVDFWSSDGCFCIEHSISIIDRYAYYALLCCEKPLRSKVRFAGIPTLDNKVVEDIKLPIPPLPVQREIVRILDNFTELTAELTAELEARKKQYEYYRSNLFDFENRDDIQYGLLKDIVLDSFWIMPATPKFIKEKEIPYVTSKDIKNGSINFTNVKYITYIDYLSISKNRPILKNDILISMIGTLGEMARVKGSDLNFYGQNMYLIRIDERLINIDYFMYFFDSATIRKYFHSIKNNSSQGYLKASHVELVRVPIPPLAEQERIVTILDRFDELTNGISQGLPAEIVARHKQYEYYRDKLLTFKEKVS